MSGARLCNVLLHALTVNVSATERPKLPESFEEDTWKKLQASVRAVHQQRPVDQSFEELYKVVLGRLTRACALSYCIRAVVWRICGLFVCV